MKRILILAPLFLFISSVVAGEDDLKLMEGTWSATFIEAGGKPLGDEFKDLKVKLMVKGNVYKVFLNDKQETEGTIKLDPAKKPKTIDASPKDGPYQDKIQPGIYEIKGDEMRVLFGVPGMDRPTEFKTKEGTKDVLISYKRVKAEKK